MSFVMVAAPPIVIRSGAVVLGAPTRAAARRMQLDVGRRGCDRRPPMPTAILRRTVAQLFMIPLPGPVLDRPSRAFLAEHPPGGVVLFKRNVRSAAQLRRLTDAVHELGAGVRPLVALDHEGGRVHRLPRPFTHFPPAAIVGARDDAR